LDFFNIFPPQGVLASRVIMSPAHIKRMAKALEENIKKYEEKYGSIESSEEKEGFVGFQVK